MKKQANIKRENEQKLIVNTIEVRPFNRESADLGKWRNATKSAEARHPRRSLLYDLYHDICTTDAHIISVWGKRVDAITLADWTFTDKEGNTVDEVNELIDCIGFEKLLKHIIDSKAWGYSMVECTFFENANGQKEVKSYLVPRKHMRPEIGHVANNEYDETGTDIREGIYAKTILEAGDATDLGLYLSAAMYAILKRGNVSDWAEFIEIFGRGIVDATWDGFDEDQRNKLSEAIKQMGGGGVIIRPEGTNLDIKNNTGSANGQLQGSFHDTMNKEISKALLGSTETTEASKSSGYAQSETHKEQDADKKETDVNFVRRTLNSCFIPILQAAGFNTKGGTFVLKSKNHLTKKERFEIAKTMVKELDIPVSDDFFYENFEIEKPEDYEKLKNELAEAKKATLEQMQENKNADTPPASDKKNKQKLHFFTDDEDLKLWDRIKSFFV
ncbi:phage portal protein family protein [Pedobacter sp. SL55]|uniref:phage portal protein family protein n=1 Tax=Pedobacter sp. SL55 TaxID=2995161 RepID=UPI0022710593|nr:DUF935 family protein [Pedobacter sp. SL55]WAC40571.1 DUF935 family protein [Pedobacter sp. SL55]